MCAITLAGYGHTHRRKTTMVNRNVAAAAASSANCKIRIGPAAHGYENGATDQQMCYSKCFPMCIIGHANPCQTLQRHSKVAATVCGRPFSKAYCNGTGAGASVREPISIGPGGVNNGAYTMPTAMTALGEKNKKNRLCLSVLPCAVGTNPKYPTETCV